LRKFFHKVRIRRFSFDVQPTGYYVAILTPTLGYHLIN
jgi:hypothetical protein